MHLEILIYASSFNIGLTSAPGGALSGPKWDKKRVKLSYETADCERFSYQVDSIFRLTVGTRK